VRLYNDCKATISVIVFRLVNTNMRKPVCSFTFWWAQPYWKFESRHDLWPLNVKDYWCAR